MRDIGTAHHRQAAVIWQADCLDIAPIYPDGRFKLLLTSPPYPGLRGFTLTGAEYESWLHARLSVWIPKVAEDGVVVLVYKFGRTAEGWFDLRQFQILRDIEIEHGLHVLDIYPWDKLNTPPAGNHDRHDRDAWEIVAVFARSDGYSFNPVRRPYSRKTIGKARAGNQRQPAVNGSHAGGHNRLHPRGARPDNVLRISSSGDQGRPRVVGGSFPRAIARRFILQHTRPGEAVVDICAGAGTTGAVAAELGRTVVLIDIDPEAVETAVSWIDEIEAEQAEQAAVEQAAEDARLALLEGEGCAED